jgi:hypothetical protein
MKLYIETGPKPSPRMTRSKTNNIKAQASLTVIETRLDGTKTKTYHNASAHLASSESVKATISTSTSEKLYLKHLKIHLRMHLILILTSLMNQYIKL